MTEASHADCGANRRGAGQARSHRRGRPARRPCLRPPCTMPCFPPGTASGRSSALPSPTPAATPTLSPPTRRRSRSSCCTAPRWCMTTSPVSTTPTCAAASPPCMLEFGEPLAVLTGDALIVHAFATLGAVARRDPVAHGGADRASSPKRSARRMASSPARPGNARSPCRSPTISAPRPGALFVAATRGGRRRRRA